LTLQTLASHSPLQAALLISRALYRAGDSAQHGLLDKEQQKQMRCYQTESKVLCDRDAMERLCADTHALLTKQPV